MRAFQAALSPVLGAPATPGGVTHRADLLVDLLTGLRLGGRCAGSRLSVRHGRRGDGRSGAREPDLAHRLQARRDRLLGHGERAWIDRQPAGDDLHDRKDQKHRHREGEHRDDQQLLPVLDGGRMLLDVDLIHALFPSGRRQKARLYGHPSGWTEPRVDAGGREAAIIAGHRAPVAQWIEYWPPKPGVVGSSPAGRATLAPIPGSLLAAACCRWCSSSPRWTAVRRK